MRNDIDFAVVGIYKMKAAKSGDSDGSRQGALHIRIEDSR